MKKSDGNIDPNVKVPPSVLAASQRADELHAQYVAPPAKTEASAEGSTESGAPKEEVTSEVTKPQSTPAEAASGQPKNDGVAAGDTRSTDQPHESGTDSKKRKKGDPEDPNDQTWESRYRAMHGRHLQASEEVRRLSARNAELEQLVAAMQTAPTQKSDGKPAEATFESLLSADERAEYGEDFLNVVAKRAQEVVGPLLKEYQDKIAVLEAKLGGVAGHVQRSEQQSLLSQLDKVAPRWRELNTDEDFLAWLALPDPYSGGIRQDMLSAAYTQGDARRVAAFFNGYIAEQTAVAPGRTDPDPDAKRVDKVPLASLAAPGRAKAATTATAPADKPPITRAQIAKFYADVASGQYRGREADKDAMEAAIFAAQRDGRIQ